MKLSNCMECGFFKLVETEEGAEERSVEVSKALAAA